MDRIKEKYQILLNAYAQLDFIVEKFEEFTYANDEKEYIIHRDALIKRFEFCFDLTWKFLKLYLEKKYLLEVASPKKVLRECFLQGIIDDKETTELLKMAEARNLTAHIYDEHLIDEIAYQIVDYYKLMNTTIYRLNIPTIIKNNKF